MDKEEKIAFGAVGLYMLGFIYFCIAWVVNLIQLFNCDFEQPYKDEIIHLIGVVFAPLSMITVWF